MSSSQIYVAVVIVVLAVLAVLLFVMRGRGGRISPLAAVAFAFITAGIVFGENRAVGYGLMGTGVILAVIDIRKSRNPRGTRPGSAGRGRP